MKYVWGIYIYEVTVAPVDWHLHGSGKSSGGVRPASDPILRRSLALHHFYILTRLQPPFLLLRSQKADDYKYSPTHPASFDIYINRQQALDPTSTLLLPIQRSNFFV